MTKWHEFQDYRTKIRASYFAGSLTTHFTGPLSAMVFLIAAFGLRTGGEMVGAFTIGPGSLFGTGGEVIGVFAIGPGSLILGAMIGVFAIGPGSLLFGARGAKIGVFVISPGSLLFGARSEMIGLFAIGPGSLLFALVESEEAWAKAGVLTQLETQAPDFVEAKFRVVLGFPMMVAGGMDDAPVVICK